LRECEARSNPVSKNVVRIGLGRIAGVRSTQQSDKQKCSENRLEKLLRECEARSNPVSKKCSENRLEKLLRECEARSNPVSKNVVRIDLRNYCGSEI